jgi:hypothetical protein
MPHVVGIRGYPCPALFFFDTDSYYVAPDGLELVIFLPQPPECWITDMYNHTWVVRI